MLRVAIIGAGSIAKRHIAAFQANPHAEIVCICDMNEERVQQIAKEHGIANYCTNYMDILKDERVDAVSILTPTFTHKSIVVEALRHGKHVLCEKPPRPERAGGSGVRRCRRQVRQAAHARLRAPLQ